MVLARTCSRRPRKGDVHGAASALGHSRASRAWIPRLARRSCECASAANAPWRICECLNARSRRVSVIEQPNRQVKTRHAKVSLVTAETTSPGTLLYMARGEFLGARRRRQLQRFARGARHWSWLRCLHPDTRPPRGHPSRPRTPEKCVRARITAVYPRLCSARALGMFAAMGGAGEGGAGRRRFRTSRTSPLPAE